METNEENGKETERNRMRKTERKQNGKETERKQSGKETERNRISKTERNGTETNFLQYSSFIFIYFISFSAITTYRNN